MSIASNLKEIKDMLPAYVKLVAVSKFHPVEAVLEAYDAGQKIFGESRQQEVSSKQINLPQDIQWHFIGHLQTNKVKAILPYTHTIHSVDSWKLLAEIEKYAAQIGKPINCLLEIHIAEEDSKEGLTFEQCEELLSEFDWQSLKYARIAGLMGMATYTDDEDKVRAEFKSLKCFFDALKQKYFKDFDYFSEISMGMSHDYRIAIEEGSTMIRVGTFIFGERKH